jgi:hypothetical protein
VSGGDRFRGAPGRFSVVTEQFERGLRAIGIEERGGIGGVDGARAGLTD